MIKTIIESIISFVILKIGSIMNLIMSKFQKSINKMLLANAGKDGGMTDCINKEFDRCTSCGKKVSSIEELLDHWDTCSKLKEEIERIMVTEVLK